MSSPTRPPTSYDRPSGSTTHDTLTAQMTTGGTASSRSAHCSPLPAHPTGDLLVMSSFENVLSWFRRAERDNEKYEFRLRKREDRHYEALSLLNAVRVKHWPAPSCTP